MYVYGHLKTFLDYDFLMDKYEHNPLLPHFAWNSAAHLDVSGFSVQDFKLYLQKFCITI